MDGKNALANSILLIGCNDFTENCDLVEVQQFYDFFSELTMEIWDNQRCKTTYGSTAPAGITDSMLCAGKKGKDSCSVSINLICILKSIYIRTVRS